MDKKLRISSKHNRMYEQTESAIQQTILKLLKSHRGRITAKQVAKMAGLTRQTIYNHHPNINQAIINNENVLIQEFSFELEKQLDKLSNIVNDHNGRIFYAMLIFMSRHREIFCPICSDFNNQELLYRMIDILYPKLDIAWLPKGTPAPNPDSERVETYQNICVGIIRRWGKLTNCNVKKSGQYVNQLIRATANIAQNDLL